VLLLAARPEDAPPLAARFQEAGVPVRQALNCYAALDLLRAHPYRGLVVWASALPEDLSWYRSRLREIDPTLRLCIVRDREGRTPPPDLPWVDPASGETSFRRLLAHLALPSRPDRSSAAAPLREMERIQEEVPPGLPASTSHVAVERTSAPPARQPDPFLAVSALLEARLAGEPPEEGLLRWALQDPGLRGWVRQEENGETRLRASADPEEDRKSMVLLLLEQLAATEPAAREPASYGPFAVFPGTLAEGSWVAVWHRDEAAAERTIHALQPLIPLLRELAPGSPHIWGDGARDRLASLLASRMRAAERRQGRLGLLLFEGGQAADATRLCKVLRALLRGGDWVEPIGSRAYVILEEPDQRVFAALGSRLRELPGIDRLRVVALGWTPLEGNAGELLDRAESILGSGGQGEGLPGVTA